MAMSLRIDTLDFRFDTHPVFHQFSLSLEPGITWLRGANGMGKTTLLKLMAGALLPQQGRILLGAIDSAAQPLEYRLATFFCGGDLPELPWLTVQEMLDLHLALYPATDPTRIDAWLAAFGIGAVLPQAMATLSLGQHRKVQLALGLSLPVGLLLLDEPFNGLDADAIAVLRAELARRADAPGACIVLTSHVDPQVPVQRSVDLN